MTIIEATIFCNNCGVEISWAPIVVKGCHFCCQECLQHLQCDCGDRMELDEERHDNGYAYALAGNNVLL